jgi:hypothetical protein
MPFFTPTDLRGRAEQYRLSDLTRVSKSAARMLSDAAAAQQYRSHFDVFLSHSFHDADLILGVYALLMGQGLTVYVDWIIDPQLERGKVTSRTAEIVRERMRQSRALIYAHSLNSGNSKWMPWELGYFDGFRSTVAILPISDTGHGTIAGVEYLSLYPYIDVTGAVLWVNRGEAPDRLFGGTPPSGNTFKKLNDWLAEQAA